MKELAGKVALVTRGSTDLGRAITLALAEAGADVAISTHQAADDAADFGVRIVAEKNVRARTYQTDLADERAVATMVATIEQDFEHIDILVNITGRTRDCAFLKMTRAMWDEVLGVNLNGPFNVTNAVLRHMVGLGWGRIINLSASGSPSGTLELANSTVTRGGLIAFTMTLARELARKGITVNAVTPGYVDGAETEAASAETRERLRQLIPMGRMARPEEVAAMVSFLAGPGASYITGQVIAVNGGM